MALGGTSLPRVSLKHQALTMHYVNVNYEKHQPFPSHKIIVHVNFGNLYLYHGCCLSSEFIRQKFLWDMVTIRVI